MYRKGLVIPPVVIAAPSRRRQTDGHGLPEDRQSVLQLDHMLFVKKQEGSFDGRQDFFYFRAQYYIRFDGGRQFIAGKGNPDISGDFRAGFSSLSAGHVDENSQKQMGDILPQENSFENILPASFEPDPVTIPVDMADLKNCLVMRQTPCRHKICL